MALSPEYQPQPQPEELCPSILLHRYDFELITGQSNPPLARRISELLKSAVDEPITLFADGEIKAQLSHTLRRKHAFIIQSTSPPHCNDYLMETFFMIDAARRASAEEITVVLPYFGYGRQDRKDEPRVAISASLVAHLLIAAGANRLVTLDIHAEQSQGFIQQPWDNLYASSIFVPVIKQEIPVDNLVVVSPDVGGTKRADKYAKALGATQLAFAYKERDTKPNSTAKTLSITGDVAGKDALIVDDILSSGGTLINAAYMLKQKGAKRVFATITHGIFLGNSLSDIEKSSLDVVYITDTIPPRLEVVAHPKIRVISAAPLLAEAIGRIHTGGGLTSLFVE